jgi:thermostable 8-oxoguanine DNA glycosylase
MRIVRLARAVGGIKCDTDIGLDHLYNPAGEAAKRIFRKSGYRFSAENATTLELQPLMRRPARA